MELYAIFMTVLVLCLSATLGLILHRQSSERASQTTMSHSFLSQMTKDVTAALGAQSTEHTKQLQMQAELVDKAMALVGTADPIAYQQVQVMGTPSGYDDSEQFDPSDEAELARIHGRSPNLAEQGDGIDGIPNEYLEELGIDPVQFYPAGYPNGTPVE